MNEIKSDYLDSELLKEADAGTPQPLDLSAENDELKTIKRLAISPPSSPPASPRGQPVSLPPPAPVSPSAKGEGGARHSSEAAPVVSRPSWLRNLLTTTFPPPGPAPVRAPGVRLPIRPQTAGTVFAVLGLVFAVVALVTGLRGAPSETVAPAVAASLVIARAVVALGAGALSFAMFRQAERLLVDEPPAKG
jgi:hypothetical protein